MPESWRSCDTSPPGLHKDGEKYIATHLVGRCGAQGGEVVITDNDKQEMDRFTMRESGECYVFDDDRIWHMLTPVAVMEGNQYAYRDTLAFDMLPGGAPRMRRKRRRRRGGCVRG
jgi:hypothetical protein